MADYWVDDGGNGSAGTSWVTAYTTLANLVTAVPAALTTSGNRIFIGHDTTQTQASALTVTGPTSGAPVILISCDRADTGAVPAFLASATNQIETTGANAITFDGSFALYGIKVKAGANIVFGADLNEFFKTSGCTFLPGANAAVVHGASNAPYIVMQNDMIDLSQDSSASAAAPINVGTAVQAYVFGLSFANVSNRNSTILGGNNSYNESNFVGCDFSGFASTIEICDNSVSRGTVRITNCKTTASTPFLLNDPVQGSQRVHVSNSGYTDVPAHMDAIEYYGRCIGTALIYRTSGGQVEGAGAGWLITTPFLCSEGSPFYTPWMYGVVSSTGSKTFDCYITNDEADFTDAQVWLEVEYLATADDAKWTLATDQRATITTTAAAQTGDTTSTWNGTGPSFTYKQKLSVTATVNETGQYRARVAVGAASIAGSRYFYIDNQPVVS